MILILVNTLDKNKKAKEKHKILLKDLFLSMILIIVNIFNINKKELYENTSSTTTTTIFSYTKKNWTILEILKFPVQTYMTISVVAIFKFVQ